mgnify:CR=1 FL=1
MRDRIRHFITGFAALLAALTAGVPALAETLDQAWETALAADRRMRAAGHLTQSAEEALAAARAARLPRLSVEGGYTVLDNAPAIVVTVPPFPPQEWPLGEDKGYSYRGTVSVPLYTSGRLAHGIEAARAGVQVARQDEARTVLDLKLQVVELYAAVLRARRGVEVAEKHVESLTAHTQDVANRFHQGQVAKNDLLAAQVALADARQRAIQAHSALDLAQASYNRQLGRALTEPVVLDELTPQPVNEELAALTARALQQRPELAGLGEQSTRLRQQAASERAASQPQVYLSGGYRYEENRYQLYEGVWSATVGVKWDLFDGGIARHQAGASHARAAFKGMQLAFELRYRGLVGAVAAPLGQRFLDRRHDVRGFLEENLEQLRIEILLDGFIRTHHRNWCRYRYRCRYRSWCRYRCRLGRHGHRGTCFGNLRNTRF